MPKIRVNPVALQDLKEIKAYITEEFSNPDAALRIVKKIIDSYSKLKDFPLTGTPLASIIDIETDFRFLVCENYIIFYKVNERYVSIYRVLYGRRDYLNVLFGKLTREES